jgi:hypothetical protein
VCDLSLEGKEMARIQIEGIEVVLDETRIGAESRRRNVGVQVEGRGVSCKCLLLIIDDCLNREIAVACARTTIIAQVTDSSTRVTAQIAGFIAAMKSKRFRGTPEIQKCHLPGGKQFQKRTSHSLFGKHRPFANLAARSIWRAQSPHFPSPHIFLVFRLPGLR